MSDPAANPPPRSPQLPAVTGQEPIAQTPTQRTDSVVDASDHGGTILVALLRLHPFMAYFCWLADQQYSDELKPHERVAKLRKRTKPAIVLYCLCVAGDWLLTLIVTAGLLALALTVAAKAVWPPPWVE